jgi:precorrin-6B methylase 2
MTWNGSAEQGLPDYPDGPTVRAPDRLAPFDPTPQDIVGRMLSLAAVTARDLVYDLGAGDGRVVIAAAKNYRAKAIGFEVDPGLVKLARENVRREGVDHLVEIRQQDLRTVDLSPATVVTLYLSYDANLALRPKLLRELKPGARVVSYTFDLAEWQPKVVESVRDAAGEKHMLYMWQISDPPVFSN